MSAKLETPPTRLDGAKWAFALLLMAGAIGAFYYFADQPLVLRVGGLLVVGAVVATVLFQTEKGRAAWEFMRDSRTEVRKVVWPTRKETVQTTLVVIGMVTVVAIFMWLLDMLLAWIVHSVIGHGG